MATCGAKTRSGTPCKKPPLKGASRCKLHGGASLKGKAAPSFKHGLYSRYIGPSLQKVLDEIDNDNALLEPANEIALMSAVIARARALQAESLGVEDLKGVTESLNRLVLAKQRAQALQIERNRLIPIQDVEKFLTHVEDVLKEFIPVQDVQKALRGIRNFQLED